MQKPPRTGCPAKLPQARFAKINRRNRGFSVKLPHAQVAKRNHRDRVALSSCRTNARFVDLRPRINATALLCVTVPAGQKKPHFTCFNHLNCCVYLLISSIFTIFQSLRLSAHANNVLCVKMVFACISMTPFLHTVFPGSVGTFASAFWKMGSLGLLRVFCFLKPGRALKDQN